MALSKLKEEMLIGLLEIRDNGPKTVKQGICGNLGSLVILSYTDVNDVAAYLDCENCLKRMFPLWPKYSGSTHYPIPGINENMVSTYADAKNKWGGEYGALRYELLDFLIAQLVEEDRKA